MTAARVTGDGLRSPTGPPPAVTAAEMTAVGEVAARRAADELAGVLRARLGRP